MLLFKGIVFTIYYIFWLTNVVMKGYNCIVNIIKDNQVETIRLWGELMNKILVIVLVPLLESEYEVYIPINKKICTIKELIIKAIVELSDNELTDTWNLKLYDNDTGDILPNDIYVKNSNLVNGTKLVLI